MKKFFHVFFDVHLCPSTLEKVSPPLHVKMSVFNSHMQVSHSLISNKPRLHTKKNIFMQ